MYDYDVIVVGGGPAGTHTALSILKHSNQRFRVLLIDRNPRAEFGKKTLSGWSCGDAVSRRSIDFVQSQLGIHYSYPELEHQVKGVVAYSPDHQTKVLFEGEGYVLNRKVWPQRQLEYLEKFGAEVMFQSTARRLIAENGFVRGVQGIGPDGSTFKFSAKLVIDASGSSSILRTNLPIQSKIEREINRDDLESTGRYILEFEPATRDETYFDPDYCIIHLDQYLAPGGYCLAADTPIVCRDGLKSIQDVRVGDEVLTSFGWMPVSNTSKRYYRGYLVVITPHMINYPVKLTPEHLVRVWNPRDGEVWKRAEDLLKDAQGKLHNLDYLVVPLPEPSARSLEVLEAKFYMHGNPSNRPAEPSSNPPIGHPTGTEIPPQVSLTESLLELCGWYVSKGCLREHHITLFIDEPEEKQRIIELTHKSGFESHVWEERRDGGAGSRYRIEITSPSLRELMVRSFGPDASKRKLPAWIYEVWHQGKTAFLRGVFSIGRLATKKGRLHPARLLFTTTSQALAIELWFLLASIGVVASIRYDSKRGSWALILSGDQAHILHGKTRGVRRRKHAGFLVGERSIFLKIKNLERTWYSGPVYDLSSAGDFTPLFNVHNCWTFPKGPNKVNIGLGVQKKALQRRNERFGENDNLKTLIDKYVNSNIVIRNARLASGPLDAGNAFNTWQVPVRRQNDCLVANGYAVVGDAAWMPRPIDAGGIGPALFASVILGRVVAEALEANDTSEAGLWKYNLEYMAGYGAQMASFEVLRRFLQNLSNEEINYGMKHFLSYEDIEKITMREHPRFGRVKLLNPLMLFRVLSNWRLASGLRYCVDKHRALVQLYSEYPEEPDKFPEWHRKFLKELLEAHRRFP